MKIWVCCDKVPLMIDLVAGAGALGAVSAVTLSEIDQGSLAQAGAEHIYHIQRPEECLPEDCLDTLDQLVEAEQPDAILFGATLTGRNLAGRLAARRGTSALADAKVLEVKDGRIETTGMVYGGGANLTQTAKGALTIVILGPGVLDKPAATTAGPGAVSEVPFVSPKWSLRKIGEEQRPVVSVDLAAAKRIVSFGLGLAQKDDIPQIKALADALQAELGCSRPIAEGLDWMPKECYMGISGNFTKGDLYLAVGVSGQVQHMVGVKDAKLIAAINKDANAPIMKQCDYGIVGDLYQVVPALIKRLS